MLTFFGLAPENKKDILKSVFELAYFSKGSISIEQAYNLPTGYRRFYSHLLEERIKKENEKAQSGVNTKKPPLMPKPKT